MSEARPAWDHDREYDGGTLGCGMLVLDLARYFRSLAPGTRVMVTAQDPGAPLDLPAWCRLTGHVLLRAEHPRYLMARAER